MTNESFRQQAIQLAFTLRTSLGQLGLDDKSLRRLFSIVEDAVWGRTVRFTTTAYDLGQMSTKLPGVENVRVGAFLYLLRAVEEFAADSKATPDAWELLKSAESFANLPLKDPLAGKGE